MKKEKLLGIPITANSLGEEQAIAMHECLDEWGLPDTAQAMCFNTTASNMKDSVELASYWSKC